MPTRIVYFSDIINNRIMKLAADGTLSVFREPSYRTNGQTFDQQGRLYHCEGAEFGPGGGRRVTRTNLVTGQYEVLTDQYDGVRYNSPNDICVDGQGRIYFTDPCYRRSLANGDARGGRLPHRSRRPCNTHPRAAGDRSSQRYRR